MKNTKRIVTGLAFAATLALSLLAGGGDAYARTKGGGGQTQSLGHGHGVVHRRRGGLGAGVLLGFKGTDERTDDRQV